MLKLRLWTNQTTRYVIIGIWNTLFGFSLVLLMKQFLMGRVGITAGVTIASFFSILQSFFTQKTFVWKSKKHYRQEILQFFTTALINYIVGITLIIIFVENYGLPLIPCQVVLTAFQTIATYYVLKRYVFFTDVK